MFDRDQSSGGEEEKLRWPDKFLSVSNYRTADSMVLHSSDYRRKLQHEGLSAVAGSHCLKTPSIPDPSMKRRQFRVTKRRYEHPSQRLIALSSISPGDSVVFATPPWEHATHDSLGEVPPFAIPALELTPKPITVPPALSLRDKCARKAGSIIRQFDVSLLAQLPRLCVERIWNQLMLTQTDSFYSFALVASVLGVHFDPHRRNDPTLRGDVVAMCQIPRGCHRLENVPLSVPINQLTRYLPKEALVVLDLSADGKGTSPAVGPATSPKMTNDERLGIYNITNLVALNLSDTYIDDNYLYALGRAIEAGKLPKLSMLLLNRCPRVTPTGILYLLGVAAGRLCYMETSHCLPSPSHRHFDCRDRIYYDYVEMGEKMWFKLDGDRSDIRMIYRLPVALKLSLIWARFHHNLDPEKHADLDAVKQHILVDFMYYPDVSINLERGWAYRARQRDQHGYGVYGYMVNDRKAPPTPPIAFTASKTDQINRGATKALRQLRKKLLGDPKSFFGS